jgi:hypothetical protein
MNTIDGASPEVKGKRNDQEWNPANGWPGYVTVLSIISLALVLSILSCCSCANQPSTTIPQELVEELTIAFYIHDNAYISYYAKNNGSNRQEKPNLTKLSESDIKLIKEMLDAKYVATILNKSNKFTCIVDVSKTGILEWYNVNKLRVRPEWDVDARKYAVFFLENNNSKWLLVDVGYANKPSPSGFPEVPEDYRKQAIR